MTLQPELAIRHAQALVRMNPRQHLSNSTRLTGAAARETAPAIARQRSSLCSRFTQMDENALLVGDDDIGAFVVVRIRGRDLGADAAVVINQMRNEGGVAVTVPVQLEPEKQRGEIGKEWDSER